MSLDFKLICCCRFFPVFSSVGKIFRDLLIHFTELRPVLVSVYIFLLGLKYFTDVFFTGKDNNSGAHVRYQPQDSKPNECMKKLMDLAQVKTLEERMRRYQVFQPIQCSDNSLKEMF